MAERLLIVDMGDLRTRAASFAVPSLTPLARIEIESAVALDGSGGGALLPAYAGMEGGPETDPVPPIADPESGQALAVGAAAADMVGYGAYLAGGCDARKLETLARAALFLTCEDGDSVDLAIVADPGQKADRTAELCARWTEAREIDVRALDPTASSWSSSGESEVRRFQVAPRMVDAGAALLELAFLRSWIEPDGPPAVVLDVGHRATRAYLLDPGAGVVDVEIVPHGGASYLEHARRMAAESRDRGRDVSLLRQLARSLQPGGAEGVSSSAQRSTEMLSFGAFTRLTRKFFEEARRELSKSVAGAVATRLRRHVERGAAWPHALVIAGGLAIPDGADIVAELRARGCTFQRVKTLPRAPSPLVEGALGLHLQPKVAGS